MTNVTNLKPTIAAVLPGGGARGAYEIGALSVLLPALEARGERVSVWCGTSVGAINATAFAATANLTASEQSQKAVELWEAMRKRDVVSPVVGIGGLRTSVTAVGHALGLPRFGLSSLLDPSPLARSLERWIDWDQLERNVDSGAFQSLCVIATSLATGEPVGFVNTSGELPHDDEIRYVSAHITPEHVRASAAIPALFPTVEVTTPRRARGHYADGAMRLNSPIKPALNLGAEKVIVIGLEPFSIRGGRPQPPRSPSIADVASNILDGLLVDQVAHDLRRLATINSFFVEDTNTGTLRSPRTYRLTRGREPYKPISYALVAPRRRGEIGRLAQRIYRERYGGLRGIREIDYMVMTRAMGGSTRSRGELLSFLLFDREFTRALIDLGQRDANRWLRRHPRFWCRDADHDLSIGDVDRSAVSEIEALEEFRRSRTH